MDIPKEFPTKQLKRAGVALIVLGFLMLVPVLVLCYMKILNIEVNVSQFVTAFYLAMAGFIPVVIGCALYSEGVKGL